jgi:8-oxo-dGTP diphosphatase
MGEVSHDSETLAEGQQVITAVAMITAEIDGATKVFLPKRADTKKFLPGVHELPGGHIDFGEDLKIGLAREIDEEFGMRITVGDVFDAFTYTNDIKRSHSVEIAFFARFVDPIENIKIDPADHSSADWFSEEELPNAYVGGKDSDDIEFQVVRKGFALLRGEQMDRG